MGQWAGLQRATAATLGRLSLWQHFIFPDKNLEGGEVAPPKMLRADNGRIVDIDSTEHFVSLEGRELVFSWIGSKRVYIQWNTASP